MSRDKPLVVACIPAYNEERTIARVVLIAQKYVDKVIVCDDGSSDMTGEIAECLGAEVIRHDRNLGYGASLRSLFIKSREIGANIMVTLDADGQHDPNNIPRLIGPILDGKADIVIGSRFLRDEDAFKIPSYRRAGIKVITRLTSVLSYSDIKDAQSGFRAYNRKALFSIIPSEQGMGASTEILLKAKGNGLRICEVPILVNYDAEASSTNPIYHGVDVILSTIKHLSIRHPMLFYGVPGFLSLLLALGFWIWTLQNYALTRQLTTNLALIAIGATLVGLMLMTTAIILWVIISAIRETTH